jgi:hypothetical protein
MMLKQLGPSGIATDFQPIIARNKIAYWDPPGNANTQPGVFGYTAPTIVPTSFTARNVAVTSLFTRMRRLGLVTAASMGALASFRVAVAQITVGDGAGNGGFFKVIRFWVSDSGAVVTVARMFFGVSSTTTAPTNVEPDTLLNSIGVGKRTADTTLHIFYGGSAAQTPIDLGSNFPANTTNTDVYELALFAPSNSNNTVYYEVTRINTGNVATGPLTGTAGTALPSSSTLLTYSWNYRTNNTSSTIVGIDIMSDYVETDN